MHSLTDSDTVAYSRSYGICITKAIKQTRIISRSHLIAFSQFFNCLFSVGNRKKLKSGRLDLLFLQRGTLQYTMLTFSVRTNLATVGHVTFVPYEWRTCLCAINILCCSVSDAKSYVGHERSTITTHSGENCAITQSCVRIRSDYIHS